MDRGTQARGVSGEDEGARGRDERRTGRGFAQVYRGDNRETERCPSALLNRAIGGRDAFDAAIVLGRGGFWLFGDAGQLGSMINGKESNALPEAASEAECRRSEGSQLLVGEGACRYDGKYPSLQPTAGLVETAVTVFRIGKPHPRIMVDVG